MSAESTVLASALGTLLGYLGGELAEISYFERLLWPQRFYNYLSFSIAAKQCLFLNMGGPIHGAALKTLDQIRKNKLYFGRRQGHMIGTAFYSNSNVTYSIVEDSGVSLVRKEARNAFWVEVSRRVQHAGEPKTDTEGMPASRDKTCRALHVINYLKLSQVDEKLSNPSLQQSRGVSESNITWHTILGILCSEVVSIFAAIAFAATSVWAMFIYMLVPLVLKYLALIASPVREGLALELGVAGKETKIPAARKFVIFDPEQDFLIVEGSPSAVQPFFRHYGHPKRSSTGSRIRELLCIAVIYAFVLYFPSGLVINVFMNSEVQYIWLAYELYAVLAMHIVRLLGWQGCGRTEERAADILRRKQQFRLQSPGGATIAANLQTITALNYSEAQKIVQELLEREPAQGNVTGPG